MLITCALLLLFVVLMYVCVKREANFWKNKGVPFVPSWPPFGNFSKAVLRLQSPAETFLELYNAYDSRYVGVKAFLTPTLIIKDLNLIKLIGIKDFDQFLDHKQTLNEDMDPLFGASLISLKGDRWRNMRSTLSPAFTGSKMRMMFILMSECAEKFANYFTEIVKPNEPLTIELKDTFSRFANDIIATTAFGIECNSVKEEKNEFFIMGKDITYFGFVRLIIFLCYEMCPSIMKKLGIHIFSDEVSNFFRGVINDNIRSREEKGIVRPDMIHLLMEARKGKLRHEGKGLDDGAGFATVEESEVGKQEQVQQAILSEADIASQALIFFFAGFDTISSGLCHIVYELTLNEDIQQKLQKEIDETRMNTNGKIDYETIVKMKYLDMVVSEGLRKWPPVPTTDRACINTYIIQPEKPGEVPVVLKRDDSVTIPIYPIHRDPKYYPNPDKFDPERFSDDNKHKIVPFSYLPFGIGPRNCIGSRFALLEAKTLIFHMLSKFNFVVVKKTQIPLKLSPEFNMNAANGFWIGLQLRNM